MHGRGVRDRPTTATVMSEDERRAIAVLWADQLARGWIPRPADLRAGLAAVRSRPPGARAPT
jgi:hypothetical protein